MTPDHRKDFILTVRYFLQGQHLGTQRGFVNCRVCQVGSQGQVGGLQLILLHVGLGLQRFDLAPVQAKYIRRIGHGKLRSMQIVDVSAGGRRCGKRRGNALSGRIILGADGWEIGGLLHGQIFLRNTQGGLCCLDVRVVF